MIFNYVRVSTIEQNTERQLRDVVCDRIYEEKLVEKIPTVLNYKRCYQIFEQAILSIFTK